jgi:hypothetical protein
MEGVGIGKRRCTGACWVRVECCPRVWQTWDVLHRVGLGNVDLGDVIYISLHGSRLLRAFESHDPKFV